MPFDPAHFVERFFSPFNPESRFYWPAVVSLLAALAVNIVWYNTRAARVTPPENATQPSREVLDRRVIAFDDELHRAVVAVPHAAGQSARRGFAHCGGPEVQAL